MTFSNTGRRWLYPLLLAMTTTLVHSLCCFLPLYTSFAVALGQGLFLRTVQPYLQGLQVVLLVYFVFRALRNYKHGRPVRVYFLSIGISLAGMAVGAHELSVTREQRQVRRVLENLQYQEVVELSFPRVPDLEQVKNVLARQAGVKWEKTIWEDNLLIVHYHSGLVSDEQILKMLVQEGYQFDRVIP